jgi:hypothetical protein
VSVQAPTRDVCEFSADVTSCTVAPPEAHYMSVLLRDGFIKYATLIVNGIIGMLLVPILLKGLTAELYASGTPPMVLQLWRNCSILDLALS